MRPIPAIVALMLLLAWAASPAANSDFARLLDQLGVDMPDESLPAAPIPGFVEVTRDMQVLYVSTDGQLVINGDILSVATETNLTDRRRAELRRELLQSVPDDDRLVVPPTETRTARIVVFTDTDCPYCLRLHRQREDLLRRGIEIQYLFYPRSGPASPSFDQAVSVWCSHDRIGALERALDGTTLAGAECRNPVMQHYELARRMDLKGTPAIITDDGDVRYGAHSTAEILRFAQRRWRTSQRMTSRSG
jgi:thiol:disulfide interchange protein DsbC